MADIEKLQPNESTTKWRETINQTIDELNEKFTESDFNKKKATSEESIQGTVDDRWVSPKSLSAALQTPDTMHKIGDTISTIRSSVGENWFLCNGEAIDKNNFPELYAITKPRIGEIDTSTYIAPHIESMIAAAQMRFVNGFYVVMPILGDGGGFYYAPSPRGPWTKNVHRLYEVNTIDYLGGYYYIGMWDESEYYFGVSPTIDGEFTLQLLGVRLVKFLYPDGQPNLLRLATSSSQTMVAIGTSYFAPFTSVTLPSLPGYNFPMLFSFGGYTFLLTNTKWFYQINTALEQPWMQLMHGDTNQYIGGIYNPANGLLYLFSRSGTTLQVYTWALGATNVVLVAEGSTESNNAGFSGNDSLDCRIIGSYIFGVQPRYQGDAFAFSLDWTTNFFQVQILQGGGGGLSDDYILYSTYEEASAPSIVAHDIPIKPLPLGQLPGLNTFIKAK